MMKSIFLMIYLIIATAFMGCKSIEKTDIEVSSVDSNLLKIANVLNQHIPEYSTSYDSKGFYFDKGIPKNFFIYSLTDTSNNKFPIEEPIGINKNGIYHFSPLRYEISFSHIAVIDSGNMEIFSFLNCKNGETIDEVIEHIKSKRVFEGVDFTIIRNYRNYGYYFQIDPQSKVMCDQ